MREEMDRLRDIKKCNIFGVIIMISGLLGLLHNINKRRKNEEKKADKYNQLYQFMAQWMETKQNNQSIAAWLRENGYETVAIYGVYHIGERLYVELADEGIPVVCGIDKVARDNLEGLKIYKPYEEFPGSDVIIVTAITDFEEIKRELEKKVECPVVSIRDVINDVLIQ